MKAAISGKQVRAARALLGWTQADLTKRSGVPARTLNDFEMEHRKPHPATTAKLLAALHAAGIALSDDGVALRS